MTLSMGVVAVGAPVELADIVGNNPFTSVGRFWGGTGTTGVRTGPLDSRPGLRVQNHDITLMLFHSYFYYDFIPR